ncbi:MAG: hypothetical protein AAF399_15485 [Bacteroidota bacterium]
MNFLSISRWLFSLLLFPLFTSSLMAQNDLPLAEIPEAPDSYEAGNVIARMIEGLGFRYHWATEGLTAEDLAYKPSEDARTTAETLDHLLGLCETVYNAARNEANLRPAVIGELSWEEKRAQTLQYLADAAELMRGKSAQEVAELEVKFKRGERESAFPYWNMLNGPLADALYHTGQIVAFRRASGNPIPSGVNVFMGTKRE